MGIKKLVIELFNEALETMNSTLKVELHDDVVLLETGLDSLGFAILVARLEEELGYDPFLIMEEAVYPVTLGEFIDIYEKYSP